MLTSNTSFLGHLCAVGIGYLRECFSALLCRNEPILTDFVSWSRLPQDLRSPREDPPMDRRQAESPGSIAALCLGGPEDVWSLWRAPYCEPRGGSTDTLELLGIYAAFGNL